MLLGCLRRRKEGAVHLLTCGRWATAFTRFRFYFVSIFVSPVSQKEQKLMGWNVDAHSKTKISAPGDYANRLRVCAQKLVVIQVAAEPPLKSLCPWHVREIHGIKIS